MGDQLLSADRVWMIISSKMISLCSLVTSFFLRKCDGTTKQPPQMHLTRLLKAREADLTGKVVLLFQPAEEGMGGAQIMIKEGALQGAQAVAGLHVWPMEPGGDVGGYRVWMIAWPHLPPICHA